MARRGETKGRRPAAAGNRRPRSAPSSSPQGDTVYGIHSVEAVLASRHAPAPFALWVQEGAAERRLAQLVALAEQRGTPVTQVTREVLDQSSANGNHQGVVAFCPALQAQAEQSLLWRLESWNEPTAPLLLVLDGVTDPHNFGACLRNVDAAGGHGVIVAKHRAAPLNGTVRKIASGAAESVPVYQVTNLARTLDALREQGVWVYGTAGEAQQTLFDVDLRGPAALVMGAEGSGMRRLTREHCDQLVKLPMAGQVSSLNVSVAAGISLFESVRQRVSSQ
ncbi:23S rRNA (guanosine(2251)-2'-O)-methyltransferase RlmB [Carnimonas nigrificans]|uniref:23S rRNA (guanosine(2251)-2'-O)-methyltransferase RlmB n=1 Tax=Carnimonas nigrificans TaxID=64323 RepID=UPI0004AE377E|nr:23S rRNA (guanosine(2251)-2'-O)-methyltransferase RlmB [Carnimonas nigrificans]